MAPQFPARETSGDQDAMSRKSGIFFLVILLAGGGYYYYHTQLSSSFLRRKKITIGGEEHEILSAATLEKIGYTLRRIPNKDNAAILYVKASNVYEKPEKAVSSKQGYVMSHKWFADDDFTKWLERNRQCLTLLHRAVRKPDCEFPVCGTERDGFPIVSHPMLPPMRAFARLLVCEGKRHESRKNYARALESYLAATVLAEHFHDSNAVMLTDLSGFACNSAANRAVENSLANHDIAEEDLRNVVERYKRVLKTHPELKDLLRREKYTEGLFVDELIRHSADAAWVLARLNNPSCLARISVSDEEREDVAKLISSKGPQLKAAYERNFEALQRWSALPAWQALKPEYDWAAYMKRLPKSDIFSHAFLGFGSTAKAVYARSKTETGALLIFAAIKLYEKKNGSPPRALNDLVPDYLSELPKDPFSGRDYVYKVRGSDWILYSVWDDLRDDGGAGRMPHSHSKDKDWVFWSKEIPVKPPPR